MKLNRWEHKGKAEKNKHTCHRNKIKRFKQYTEQKYNGSKQTTEVKVILKFSPNHCSVITFNRWTDYAIKVVCKQNAWKESKQRPHFNLLVIRAVITFFDLIFVTDNKFCRVVVVYVLLCCCVIVSNGKRSAKTQTLQPNTNRISHLPFGYSLCHWAHY